MKFFPLTVNLFEEQAKYLGEEPINASKLFRELLNEYEGYKLWKSKK